MAASIAVCFAFLSLTYLIEKQWGALIVSLVVVLSCITWSITYNGLAY